MTCQGVNLWLVIVPPLLWLLWYGPRSDRRYNAAIEGFHDSPLGKRYVKALERIAAKPQSTTRSGSRKPRGRGR